MSSGTTSRTTRIETGMSGLNVLLLFLPEPLPEQQGLKLLIADMISATVPASGTTSRTTRIET